jgi:hypothetical protein
MFLEKGSVEEVSLVLKDAEFHVPKGLPFTHLVRLWQGISVMMEGYLF